MLRIDDLREVSRAILSQLFRCSGPAINAMVQRGMPRLKSGRYNLFDVVQWRFDELVLASGKQESGEARKWLTRYRKARALREELAHKKDQEAVCAWTEIERQWAERVREVAAGLEAWSDRLPALLVNRSREDIHALIKSEVRALRLAYSRQGKYTPEVIDVDAFAADIAAVVKKHSKGAGDGGGNRQT